MRKLGQPEGASPMLSFRVSGATVEALKFAAKRNGVTVSEQARRWLEASGEKEVSAMNRGIALRTPKAKRLSALWKRELEIIREKHGGTIRPEDVVEFAKDPSTALHECFEWNDRKAAKKGGR